MLLVEFNSTPPKGETHPICIDIDKLLCIEGFGENKTIILIAGLAQGLVVDYTYAETYTMILDAFNKRKMGKAQISRAVQ